MEDVDGEPVVGGEPSWELDTCQLTEVYAKLAFTSEGGEIPACPVEFSETSLVLAVPADVTPWLPSFIVPLADPYSHQPSADGASVVASVIRVAHDGCGALHENIEAVWTQDGRWPAADGLCSLPQAEEVMAPRGARCRSTWSTRCLPQRGR